MKRPAAGSLSLRDELSRSLIMTVYASFAYVFMEWLFVVTKP